MRKHLTLLFFGMQFCLTKAHAQSLQLFRVDTADAWVSHFSYFHPITLSGNTILMSYLNSPHVSTSSYVFGDVKINTYNTAGVLLEQEMSLNDSVFITKTILKSNGEKILLGNVYSHLTLYDLDTTHSNDENSSFIMHLDAANHVLHYQTFVRVNDMRLDEAPNVLYFVEQYNDEEARLYRFDLTGGTLNMLTTIDGARVNARILKTTDYIYVAGSTIQYGVQINGHTESTAFDYGTFILQLDHNGNYKWINFIEDITTPHIDLAAAPDQGVYMCADLQANVTIGAYTLQGPNWGNDYFLTRIDTTGLFLWAGEAPNNTLCGFSLGPGFSLDSDSAFNVYMAGSSRSLLQWDSGLVIGRDTNIFVPAVLVYDKEGNIVKHFIAGEGEQAYFISIDVEPGGDFVVTGKMTDFLTFGGVTRSVTSGYQPYFLYYKNVPLQVNEPIYSENIFVYPNPAGAGDVLQVRKKKQGTAVLELYNGSGQKIKQQNIDGQTGSIPLNGLKPGMYVLRMDGQLVQKIMVH